MAINAKNQYVLGGGFPGGDGSRWQLSRWLLSWNPKL